MKTLILSSLENGVKRLRLSPEIIESYYEFEDGSNKSKTTMIIEAFSGDLFMWADDVLKFLSKSKSQIAKKLIAEFEEIYEGYENELEMLEEFSELGNGRIIKLLNGSMYLVSNSLEDIEIQLEEIDKNERFGF